MKRLEPAASAVSVAVQFSEPSRGTLLMMMMIVDYDFAAAADDAGAHELITEPTSFVCVCVLAVS